MLSDTTSLHEAAHAFVALALDIDVTSVTIDGDARVELPDNERPIPVVAAGAVALAGSVVEQLAGLPHVGLSVRDAALLCKARLSAAEVDQAGELAKRILTDHRRTVVRLAHLLEKRRTLTGEQLRAAVEIALHEFPKLSSRAIAQMCGVGYDLVLDVRPRALSDSDNAPQTADSARPSAVITAGAGAPRMFCRDAKAWIEDPGDGRIVEIGNDQPKLTSKGCLFELGGANRILRSSFISGTTGLTLAGTAVNGSAIATTYGPPLLFDTAVTPQGLKFTAGNPHAADLTARWPDTSVMTSGQGFILSVDHVDINGTALYWRCQRLNDNKYWKQSDQTWQVAAFDNAFAITASATVIERHWTDAIDFSDLGAGTTALRFTLLLPSGGTASRQNNVYHVQGDYYAKEIRLSRLVTDTAIQAGAWDQMIIRAEPPAQGTILFAYETVIGLNLAANEAQLLCLGMYPFTSDYYYIRWIAGQWEMRGRGLIGDTERVAYLVGSAPAVGTPRAIAGRYTGASGELGLPPYTMSIFVDGVKGTDSVALTNQPVMTGKYIRPSYLAPTALGYLKLLRLIPRCLTDDEIAAWSAAALAL